MIDYQLTTAVIGIAFAATILYLVRRDHLHSLQALWWLFIAGLVAVLGVFPHLADRLGTLLGVHYPPILALLLGLCLVLLKLLLSDIQRARTERKLLRMAQRLAILEARQKAGSLLEGRADADP